MTKLRGQYTLPPLETQGKGCNLCPGGIRGLYEREGHVNFAGDSYDSKLKVLIQFLLLRLTFLDSLPTFSE